MTALELLSQSFVLWVGVGALAGLLVFTCGYLLGRTEGPL